MAGCLEWATNTALIIKKADTVLMVHIFYALWRCILSGRGFDELSFPVFGVVARPPRWTHQSPGLDLNALFSLLVQKR